VSKPETLLIVGSMAFDDLEMPFGVFENTLGGSATYSSLAASLLAPARLVAVIGNDFAEAELERLRKRGVDTTGVERADGKTFRWRGRYSEDLASRVSLDTQLNVFADFKPKLPVAYRKTPFVLLGNIHPALQIDVVDQIERPRLVAADTMNFWISGEPATLSRMLKRIDLLVINEEEARQLSGVHNLVRAAADIRKRGPSKLVIKRGEFGALLFDEGGTFFVPAYPLEDVRDPTGAGDTFAGGLMGYLAHHADASPLALRRALFFASALGSFCVEDVGPNRLLDLTRKDLLARIEAFSRLVDFGGSLPVSM
jgi:sugar/nucleoside kinase (ribokinase family)